MAAYMYDRYANIPEFQSLYGFSPNHSARMPVDKRCILPKWPFRDEVPSFGTLQADLRNFLKDCLKKRTKTCGQSQIGGSVVGCLRMVFQEPVMSHNKNCFEISPELA